MERSIRPSSLEEGLRDDLYKMEEEGDGDTAYCGISCTGTEMQGDTVPLPNTQLRLLDFFPNNVKCVRAFPNLSTDGVM